MIDFMSHELFYILKNSIIAISYLISAFVLFQLLCIDHCNSSTSFTAILELQWVYQFELYLCRWVSLSLSIYIYIYIYR